MTDKKIRVRFAPSPTGFLHIGGVRTALFNWLYAKKTGGTFILRIEDTDEKRSSNESLHAIIDGLSWLGLHWDEGPAWGSDDHIAQKGGAGPYFQMERLDIYGTWIKRLTDLGRVYPCWCTKEQLGQMRAGALAQKKSLKYDGRCKRLTEEQKKENLQKNIPHVFRFNVRDADDASFTDLIHGPKEFDVDLIEDFIVIKSTGGPTYNFAAVIDDHLMGITHVIRGDDHLSNTPRQVLLYRALGFCLPQFAHLPMILGPDGSRLSKRHGATSLAEYADSGYLPEAIINYLALLGWSTQDSQQLFKHDELIEKFSIERCSKSSAIFDPQKLLWMNGEYMRGLEPEDFIARSLPWLKEKGFYKEGENCEDLKKAVVLEQDKVKRLDEIPQKISFLVTDTVEFQDEAVAQWLHRKQSQDLLAEIKKVFEQTTDFSAQNIETIVRAFAKKSGVKNSLIFHPLRVAVSGRTQGPSLFEMLSFLGKERVIKRLEHITCFIGGAG